MLEHNASPEPYSERSTIGYADRQIGEYCNEPVCQLRLEGQIMRYLMNG